jgi:transcriptional regulator with XRE-family HTH domain
MAVMGPTTSDAVRHHAANLLKVARAKKHLTQRELADAAGVPQSTVARIESGVRQPSLPVLARILAAVDLEMRIRLEPYDDHDDVLAATQDRLTPAQRALGDKSMDEFFAKFTEVSST